MSGGSFAASWLALREPADAAARSAALVRRLRERGPAGGDWRILDLAAGAGANRRWLAPRLGATQHWTVVDNDPRLLVHAGGPGVRQRRLDLVRDLERLDFRRANLVTASALLDLVSEAWLERLVACCRGGPAALLFALCYDGEIAWTPVDEGDAIIRQLLNRHQHGDKGFGPAVGPAAGRFAASLLAGAGYRVWTADTPWRLGPAHGSLQAALLDGWAAAAGEVAPEEAERIAGWARRRHALIAAAGSRLRVGHLDVLAWPQGRRVTS